MAIKRKKEDKNQTITTKTRKTREGSESSKRRRLSSDNADDSDDEGAMMVPLTPPSVAPLAEQKEGMTVSLMPPSIVRSAATQKEKKKKPTAEPTAPTPAPGPAPADRPTSSEPESATVDHEPATADQNVAAPAKTFKELGVVDVLCETCERLGYTKATPIQEESIPVALTGRDIIGIAETGSGKTAAFALPILQSLLENNTPLYALVLAPTRELAVQIQNQFDALGSIMGLRSTLIVGGMEKIQQSISLGKKPHVIVATPGRILDHLESTKGFNLHKLKFLVMDEADRLIDQDFGPVIEKILKFLPRERNTFLFSATMSSKVESLQRASLRDPVKVSVSSSKYATVENLKQHYLFVPHMHKDTYLVFLCNEFAQQTIIIFTRTVLETQRVALLLRALGMSAIPLHGGLSQSSRLGALNKFRAGSRSILVATDVAARGLDIPNVDCVINFDLPQDSKTYVHRVGRTARAGKSGVAISVVTQYDIEIYKRIEKALKKELEVYPAEKDEVMMLKTRTEQAQRTAKSQLKELVDDRGNKGSTLRGTHKRRAHPGSARDNMDKEEM